MKLALEFMGKERKNKSIKTRTKARDLREGEVVIKSYEIERLQKFWSDSNLVFVTPEGIFAQRVCDIKIREDGIQRLLDFNKFEFIFKKVP